jgi:hypothetical protein
VFCFFAQYHGVGCNVLFISSFLQGPLHVTDLPHK